MRFSPHFYGWVQRQRPFITEAMCIETVNEPVYWEMQPNGRMAYWKPIDLLGDGQLRYLCVITLDTSDYVITAFPDRDFLRKKGGN